VAIAMLAVLIAAGCASVEGQQTPQGSGVAGVTVVDAGCPNTARGGHCPDNPIRAHLYLIDERSGAVVGRTDSAADGSFHIDATPGHYLLHAAGWTSAPLPSAPAPQPVEVREGNVTILTVRFDSGVR
jgi:hypothetical protein